MSPTVTPPIAAPPDDPVLAALNEPSLRLELKKHALACFSKHLANRPLALRIEEAEDAVQETLKRALASQCKFDPASGTAAGWIHGIMSKVCLETCRNLRSQPQQSPASLDAFPERSESPRSMSELTGLLDRLASEERQLVVWHHLDELSHLQISEKLGISPGACRVKLSRIMTELKRIANEKEGAR
jgi:RNA polymerase sigma factor (sigma-70 family)